MLTCFFSSVANMKSKIHYMYFHFLKCVRCTFSSKKLIAMNHFFPSNIFSCWKFTLASFKLAYGVFTNKAAEKINPQVVGLLSNSNTES